MRYKAPTLPKDTTLNVFQALHLVSPGDITVARQAFVARYGWDIYNTYIRHYAEGKEPAFLIYAPIKQYTIWMWNKVCEIVAERTGREFLLPPEWIAIEPTDDEITQCTECGHWMIDSTKEDGQRFGISGPICIICWMNHTDLWKPPYTFRKPNR